MKRKRKNAHGKKAGMRMIAGGVTHLAIVQTGKGISMHTTSR